MTNYTELIRKLKAMYQEGINSDKFSDEDLKTISDTIIAFTSMNRLLGSALELEQLSNFDTTENLDYYMKDQGYERRDKGNGIIEYGIPNQPSEIRVQEDSNGYLISVKKLVVSRKLFSTALSNSYEEIESMTKLQKLAAMGMLGLGLAGTPAYAKGNKDAPKESQSIIQQMPQEVSYDDYKQYRQQWAEEEGYDLTDRDSKMVAFAEFKDMVKQAGIVIGG